MATLPWPTGNDQVAGEQAALRRVATLVARAAVPETVFAAVTEEAGRLLHADYAMMGRYGAANTVTAVAAWSSAGSAFPLGSIWGIGGQNIQTTVFQARRPARIDDYNDASGPIAEAARKMGLRAVVGVPVSVEGRLWGVMAVGSTRGALLAATEARLAGFTELAATAIANSQARVELRGFAEEQAALRRVATLVARAAPPEEVFAAQRRSSGRADRVPCPDRDHR
jgi:GAF domain-containing protein